MNEPVEGLPIGDQSKPKEYPVIRSRDYGYHYTVVDALPDTFKHGLLSRREEQKRGLAVRPRASRSLPDTVYFTTDIEDLYFRRNEDDDNLNASLKKVVGIAIETPDYVDKEGHFGEVDIVATDRFKAIVIIDTNVNYGRGNKYDFEEPLPDQEIEEKVKVVREACDRSNINLPIYGVSGNLYWPERLTREQIRIAKFKD